MEHSIEGPISFRYRIEGLTQSVVAEEAGDELSQTANTQQLIFAAEAAFGHFISELALLTRWNIERIIGSLAEVPHRSLILEALGLPEDFRAIETVTAPLAIRDLLFRVDRRGTVEVGSPLSLVLLRWPGGGIELFATDAQFGEGSWKEVVVGSVAGVFAGLLTVPAAHHYNNHVQSIRWERTAQATVCHAKLGFSLDLDEVRAITLSQLDFRQDWLTEREKKLAVCRVQLALQVLGYATGDVDGVMGVTTETALKAFAQSVHVKHGDWQSDEVLQALAFAFTQKRLEG